MAMMRVHPSCFLIFDGARHQQLHTQARMQYHHCPHLKNESILTSKSYFEAYTLRHPIIKTSKLGRKDHVALNGLTMAYNK